LLYHYATAIAQGRVFLTKSVAWFEH
jgi:hypothetical protein